MTLSEVAAGLLLAAVAAPGIFVLNCAWQLRRSDAGAGWFSGLLSLVAALAVLAVLVVHVFWQAITPDPVVILVIAGLAELGVGGLILAVERRRAAFVAGGSFGMLIGGIGFFTAIMALFVPLLPGQFWPAAAPAPTPTLTMTRTPTVAPSARPAATATGPATPARTAFPTPTALPTASPTRMPYRSPTPSATPTVVGHCGAVVNYNLNLRAWPSLEAEILHVIPYQTIIQVGGQNRDGTWWFVAYNGIWGWVDGRYISLDTDCATAPMLSE